MTETIIDGFRVEEETRDPNTGKATLKYHEISLSEEEAIFNVKIRCLPYLAYDSGYDHISIPSGKIFEKDCIQIRISYTPIKLKVMNG